VTLPARSRRRIDRIVAAGLAVLAIALAAVVWLTSDIRATTSNTSDPIAEPSPATGIPDSLKQVWTAATDAKLGAVVSPYGVVVTTDPHTVTGRDATTGRVRWSYQRSNLPMCAVGSGDTDTAGGGVEGVVVLYEKNGWCSQIQSLDPSTGARKYARTSANQTGGSLIFGGPYAGWVGSTLMELWRYDLVRTLQYGDQPNPQNPNTRHIGCTFDDAAVTDQQVATIEHCPADGNTARVVFNWADPGSGHDKQNQYQHTPRAEIDTGSPVARLVGITRDRAAVLVTEPTPALVIYDADGSEASRTPVDIPASEIAAVTGITPSVTVDGIDNDDPARVRYNLIGSHLLAVQSENVEVSVTSTPTPTTTANNPGGAVAPATSVAPTVTQENRDSLTLRFVASGALGLPAVIDGTPLLPVDAGLAELDKTGLAVRTIDVDRGDYSGRVDAAAVGKTVVETRGDAVVAYRG
jgi:hypothetical protein